MMPNLFSTFLVLLLSIAPAAYLSRRWRYTGQVLSGVLSASLLLGLALAVEGLWHGTPVSLDLSQVAPLSFTLAVDRLSAFFLLLICFIAAPVVIYSGSYIGRHYGPRRAVWIWILLPLFLLSMIVVVTASSAFAFLFGWELMTLFSAGLIVVDGDSERRRHNILIYLLMMHAGAAAVFAAFLMCLPHSAGLGFAEIKAAAALLPPSLRTAVFLLSFIGFGTKAGVVPLHLWLPKAHPIAPSPVSALMSGVMLKTAVYGFVRFGFDFLGTGAIPDWWGYLVLAVGGISGLLGVLYAIAENDLKRLLAYCSVENIGIIYLGLGAAFVFEANGLPQCATVALVAALLHCLNHAIFKSLLFLGAGAISDATHTLAIEKLGGLQKRMRVSGVAFLVACSSVSSLPLFNGFVSEWLTFRSFLLGSGIASVAGSTLLPMFAGVLALIGGLALACFAKAYGVAFLGRPRSVDAENANDVPLPMKAGMVILAAACVVIGIVPGFLIRALAGAVGEFVPAAALPGEVFLLTEALPWIAAIIAAGVLLIAAVKRAKKITATWACGLPTLDERMQYSSTAFSKPLRRAFARVYKQERTVEALPIDQPYFPVVMSYRSVRTTSFERSFYRPGIAALVGLARRLRRWQTGNIQVYLLYIFAALILLLILMRWA